MGGSVAGKPFQGPADFNQFGDARIRCHHLGQLGFFLQGLVDGHLQTVWNQLGNGIHLRQWESQGPSHIPDHQFGFHLAEGDDLGHIITAAVTFDHIVIHPFPSVDAKIHVDVRHADT